MSLSKHIHVQDLDGAPLTESDIDGLPLDKAADDIDGVPSKCVLIRLKLPYSIPPVEESTPTPCVEPVVRSKWELVDYDSEE